MKLKNLSNIRRLGGLAAVFLFTYSLRADPIPIPEKSVTPEISFLIGFSIFLEAACILFLLRHFRRPRLFVLWVLGLHLITYPTFLGLLWLFQDMRPAFAAALGEGMIVIIEGTLIYLICRHGPTKKNLPTASLIRCWLISLAGNFCSLIAFPLLMRLYDLISRHA
jgi:hypothetical protein